MSDEPKRLEDLLKSFSTVQLRFIAARPYFTSDKDTAKYLNIPYLTIRSWNNKQEINEALRLMAQDGVVVATEIFRRNVTKAAQEIADELDHKSVGVRHTAATDILDRIMGKATQPVELYGKVEYVVFGEGNVSDDPGSA